MLGLFQAYLLSSKTISQHSSSFRNSVSVLSDLIGDKRYSLHTEFYCNLSLNKGGDMNFVKQGGGNVILRIEEKEEVSWTEHELIQI